MLLTRVLLGLSALVALVMSVQSFVMGMVRKEKKNYIIGVVLFLIFMIALVMLLVSFA